MHGINMNVSISALEKTRILDIRIGGVVGKFDYNIILFRKLFFFTFRIIYFSFFKHKLSKV